jgi:hypothetical protein
MVVCSLFGAPLSDGAPLSVFLLFAQGGAIYAPDAFIPTLIFGSLPLLAFLYLFSDFLKSDLDSAAVYLFTRKNNRVKWLVKKVAQLLFCSTALYLVVCAVLAGVYLLIGGAVPTVETFGQAAVLFFPLVVLNSLFTCFAALLINILSFRFGSLGAFVAIAALHFFCVFICVALPAGVPSLVAHLLPSTQGVFTWHEIPAFLGDYSGLFARGTVPGFPLVYSYVYLALFIVIVTLIGARLIKRIDLL